MNGCRESCSRLARLVDEAVARLGLDLSGLQVLTEAATGPYVVTPVIAARAGARVVALAKASSHGTLAEIRRQTAELAEELDVVRGITVVDRLSEDHIAAADVVTNSGHVRPLDAHFVHRMRPGAVIPLMYEAWELRPDDVNLDACRGRGVIVAGVNERHPQVRVFDYLGMMVVHGLLACGVAVVHARILLLCDNPFGPYIEATLVGCGAQVHRLPSSSGADGPMPRPAHFDAVVVAATPGERPTIGRSGQAKYAVDRLGRFDALVQLWGDVDRECLPECLTGVVCYPPKAPRPRHMGILPSVLGPEPVVRLQAAGLKVGQVLAAGEFDAAGGRDDYVDAILAPPQEHAP